MTYIFEMHNINELLYLQFLINQPEIEHAVKYDYDGCGFGSTLVINTNAGVILQH